MKGLNNNRIEIILNKSLTYFLPIVDAQVDFRFLYLLRNAYLSNGESVDGEEFCVLYEWSSDIEYTAWEKKLMEHHLYVGHEDYDKMVLYKFRLSKKMREAKTLFINGKYSMFTLDHKDNIEAFLIKRNASNTEKIMRILNRDEDLRLKMNEELGVNIDPNDELSSKPNIFNEDFSNFYKEVNFKIEDFLNKEDEGKES